MTGQECKNGGRPFLTRFFLRGSNAICSHQHTSGAGRDVVSSRAVGDAFVGLMTRLGLSLRPIDNEHGVSGAILDASLVDRDVTPVALLLSAED